MQALAGITSLLEPLDYVAVGLLLGMALAMRLMVEHCPDTRPSTSRLMANYRREWMRVAASRSARIIDSQLLISLRAGAAFFASGTILAIGGLVALLGQAEQMLGVVQDLVTDLTATRRLWELKLLFVLCLTVDSFLKFVWAHRIFGYCAVLLGAIPERDSGEDQSAAISRAGELQVNAARSYNRGLRGIYFALAAMAWFLGPIGLIIAALVTAGVIFRREFLSETRRMLL
ncbi:MAG: DUF599 domain-containing protein [Pseudomonadota bacterium]